MSSVVQEIHKVGAWAEVTLLPGKEREARQRLTLTFKESGLSMPQYRPHPTDDTKLYIPRAIAQGSGLEVFGEWQNLNANSKLIEPRNGQAESIALYMKAINSTNPYGGIMQAVTGAGKTVMALDIAVRLGLKTLIIVPRSSLMEQWRLQVMKWTDCDEDDIGIVQGPKRNYKNKKFTIAMIHTLAQQYEKYEKEFFLDFGTVIFDECHVVGAETFSQVAPMFRCKYRVGLSATPRRQDGMDQVFYWHIGPIVSRFTELQAKARVRVIKYQGRDTTHEGCVWAGKLNLGRFFNRVAKSEARLQLVAKIVDTLNQKDHDILVLSDRVQYLHVLKSILLKKGVDESRIGFLIGTRKDFSGKKIILGTYGSAGMGVDIPRLTALVLATPRADIEQAVGRVLRQGTPIIVDVLDTASHIMLGWFKKRMKYYKHITDDIQGSN